MKVGVLIFFCGKMAAGKTTLSKKIALDKNAVLLCEDHWLSSLYPGEIKSVQDYVKYSNRLKPQIENLVQSLLSKGINVVMDFPGNTRSQRQWFKGIFEEAGAAHELVFINVDDSVCIDRLYKRRQAQGDMADTDTLEMFANITRYFQKPEEYEGFNIICHE